MKFCKRVGVSNLCCSLRLSYFRNYDTKKRLILALQILLSYSSTSSESGSSVQITCNRAYITLFCWKTEFSINSINSEYGNNINFSNHETVLKIYNILKQSEPLSLTIWALFVITHKNDSFNFAQTFLYSRDIMTVQNQIQTKLHTQK